ncbi:SET domain-containing protein [Artomyces pyxidatus]|uniref:SET domain-containing protein n=1 Tax=Artomyces pyxidatus TaxID=48021 RepID=A0ACB8SL36_9AGAM|nr:SET domain-containing protein [Artomyces pyxidatus]
MSGTPSIPPSEGELKSSVVSLKESNPTLGIPKFHALLLSEHPTWIVSEKRVRRVLQSEGLVQMPKAKAEAPLYPSSALIDDLDLTKWTPAVEVKYFDKRKGKGLVAKTPITEGQAVWKEDPFVIAPEWDIYDLQQSSQACSFCTTPLGDSTLVVRCPASTSAAYCSARFCTRLCLSRSAKSHPLVCAAQNPASVPLLAFARKSEWMALHAITQCTARLLLANQSGSIDEDWKIFRAFAELGMEERAKGSWYGGAEPDRASWTKAHQLYVQAFKPSNAVEQKKLARILKKSLAEDISEALFSYSGFLHGLGRMSLNLEAHGGLYTLHSHLNHDCTPNISVRHLDQRTALSRITLIAKRDINVGEELLVTYVNPELEVRERRAGLAAWAFGECRCERCLREEKEAGPAGGAGEGFDDLERELKAGLGVM